MVEPIKTALGDIPGNTYADITIICIEIFGYKQSI